MSIYATIGNIALPVQIPAGRKRVRDAFANVYIQGVPCHIDSTGPGWDEWLPAPKEGCTEDCGNHLRAVFFTGPYTTKGERFGQEYTHPVLVLTGDEYREASWMDLYSRLSGAIEEHMSEGYKRRRTLDVSDIIPDPFGAVWKVVKV